jgi:MFS family permease
MQNPPATRQTTPQERQQGFRLLFVCLMCTGIGQSIIFTILPPLARKLHLSETETGGIFLASGLIWVVASPWWGRKSDLWGRKPVILIGLVGYALSMTCLASVLLAGVAGLIVGPALFLSLMSARAIYGILGSGTFPAAQAYVADRTSEAERTSGVSALSAAFGLGATLGPGLGAALVGLVAAMPGFIDLMARYSGFEAAVTTGFSDIMAELSLVAPLYAVSILALVSAVLITIRLPERTRPQGSLVRAKLRLTDRRIIPHIIVGTAISIVQGIQAQTVNFYFMDTLKLPIEASVSMVGVALTTSAFAAFATQFFVVQQFNLSVRALLRWGGILSVIGFGLFLATQDYAAMVLGLVLASVGMSLIRPGNAAAASLAVSRSEQGAVAGLTGAAGALGFVVGPVASLPLYASNHALPFWLCLGATAATLIYSWLHPSMSGQHIEPPPPDHHDVTGL